ncbi:helix-turn-helix domain-containing protein [Halorarius halobius]|uniref:helix-turn-helix domain-containing protein n=1 Tax=Halorarius halobius TaxID=2962671 RepID=UPI0020CD3EDC|nr:helix-turn-helix domain-containing protein [Halorarius halobius]
MRRARFLLRSRQGPFELVGREAPPSVDPDALLHLDLLQDGTGVTLYRLTGDRAAMRETLAAADPVRSFDIFEAGGTTDAFHARVHFQPTEPVATLLSLVSEHRLTVDPPLEFVDETALRVTVAGKQSDIRAAADAVPDALSITLERAGRYHPSTDELASVLTDRQRQVLATAVAVGYYDTPRTATQADVAEALDCSAGTVGEHLRKIQARVLREVAEEDRALVPAAAET